MYVLIKGTGIAQSV